MLIDNVYDHFPLDLIHSLNNMGWITPSLSPVALVYTALFIAQVSVHLTKAYSTQKNYHHYKIYTG